MDADDFQDDMLDDMKLGKGERIRFVQAYATLFQDEENEGAEGQQTNADLSDQRNRCLLSLLVAWLAMVAATGTRCRVHAAEEPGGQEWDGGGQGTGGGCAGRDGRAAGGAS
eukprot:COSAG04_NODE_504_length_13347_cov_231.910251_8_plen_112_part_00